MVLMVLGWCVWVTVDSLDNRALTKTDVDILRMNKFELSTLLFTVYDSYHLSSPFYLLPLTVNNICSVIYHIVYLYIFKLSLVTP